MKKNSINKYIKLGITNPSKTEWYRNCTKGFSDFCLENNIEILILETEEDLSIKEQKKHIKKFISQKVNAIGIILSDCDALVPDILRCKKAGILVGVPGVEVNIPDISDYTIDVTVIGDNYIPSVKMSNYIGKKLNGKGNILIINGIPKIKVSGDRDRGLKKGFSEFPSINILETVNGYWDDEKTYKIMIAFLNKYKVIDGVFGGWDGGSIACYEAAKSKNRENKIFFFGFNGDEEGLRALAENKIIATVSMNSYNLGYLLARDLYRAATYSQYQKVRIGLEYKLITRENLLDLYPEYSKIYIK